MVNVIHRVKSIENTKELKMAISFFSWGYLLANANTNRLNEQKMHLNGGNMQHE